MEQTEPTGDEVTSDDGDFIQVHEHPEPVSKPRDLTKLMLGAIVVLLIGVLVLQFTQLRRFDDVNDEVAALAQDVTDLKPLRGDVDTLTDQVAALGGDVTAAVDAAAAAAAAAEASPAEISSAAADGNLPIFESSANDPAVLGELTLATISGPEYYTNADTTFSPTDGKARVWLVWAHWCPYCQAELPDLQTWWPENSSRFPNVELVTVTSAIDDSRSNPLLPYLDAEQFSFPVIVDQSGAISQQFGTAAFPFWVVTDSEGTVVLRIAGAVGIEAVDQIFTQLESMTSGT